MAKRQLEIPIHHRPTDVGYPYPTSVADVIALAEENGVTIFFLDSDLTDDVADEISMATGGDVFLLSSASEEVVAAIDDAISTAIRDVEVRVEPTGMGAEFVTDIQPEFQIRDLLTDEQAIFEITLSNDLESSDVDREFTFNLVFSVDGAEISRQGAIVAVPAAGTP